MRLAINWLQPDRNNTNYILEILRGKTCNTILLVFYLGVCLQKSAWNKRTMIGVPDVILAISMCPLYSRAPDSAPILPSSGPGTVSYAPETEVITAAFYFAFSATSLPVPDAILVAAKE